MAFYLVQNDTDEIKLELKKEPPRFHGVIDEMFILPVINVSSCML